MKNIIIKNERNHQVISGNAISILDKLPPAIYELSYTPERGFSLDEADSYFRNSEKLYGEVEAITEKVLNTFDTVDGNLGVLFSGPKGLGKSLTVRNICRKALSKDLPVILVKEHFENITPFIEAVCQPVVIVFDEFEKIYHDNSKTKKDSLEGQESLLNLFDPSLEGKKLFLLTYNDVHNISEYLLNRPGRLHYHFKMNRLSIEEITEYCKDKLTEDQHGLIPDICSLGARIPDFSYDMLRSVIFELNTYKCGIAEVCRILNIDAGTKSPFNYTVYFKSGKKETGFDYINMNDIRCHLIWYRETDGSRDSAMANMREICWTGDLNGSLLLEGKSVCWREERKKDSIEKILFIPAKEGYLDRNNDWD